MSSIHLIAFVGGDSASAVQKKISQEGEAEGIHFNWDKVGLCAGTPSFHLTALNRLACWSCSKPRFDRPSRLTE